METLVKKLGSRFETTPSLSWTMHVHCILIFSMFGVLSQGVHAGGGGRVKQIIQAWYRSPRHTLAI